MDCRLRFDGEPRPVFDLAPAGGLLTLWLWKPTIGCRYICATLLLLLWTPEPLDETYPYGAILMLLRGGLKMLGAWFFTDTEAVRL